ncbi:HIT family protein [Desertibacillus haloalkaliphilus]|uniref:HIT family protein n=1 Tax=Desertibacillus haloalkaliphilus TaxID=1328930 RepID=UPI001C25BFBC|nr:HIT family protein [Desertibacillus haloalkaliphilus]MBU8907686.1 HIT family protein [Desertibacillus haloalkaliphilus]
MTNYDCFYCTKDDRLERLMMNITEMKISNLYLLKDQTHKGRCVLALTSHKTELFQLTKEERTLFMEDVSKASKAINEAFSPNKINYAIYGDLVSHLHFHLVPKYREGEDWGRAFDNEPAEKKILTTEQYQERMNALLQQLN